LHINVTHICKPVVYKIHIMINKTAETAPWGHDENDFWKASG